MAQTPSSPEAVVKKIYAIDKKDPANTPALKAYLTPELYKLIRDVENKPVPKGDVGDIDGDLFTNSQEDYTKLEILPGDVHGNVAHVNVTISIGDDARKYVITLKNVNGKWKMDDEDWGKDGTLRQMMTKFAPK